MCMGLCSVLTELTTHHFVAVGVCSHSNIPLTSSNTLNDDHYITLLLLPPVIPSYQDKNLSVYFMHVHARTLVAWNTRYNTLHMYISKQVCPETRAAIVLPLTLCWLRMNSACRALLSERVVGHPDLNFVPTFCVSQSAPGHSSGSCTLLFYTSTLFTNI